MDTEDKVLAYVIEEFKRRGLIRKDIFEQTFGCQSWDEVASGIKDIIK